MSHWKLSILTAGSSLVKITIQMANKMRPIYIILLIINAGLAAVFGTIFLLNRNYEFIIYVGVIILCLILIGVTFFKAAYSTTTLLGLTIWSLMHMTGGGVYINNVRLYDIILIPLSQTYPILRYDQLVHLFGFAAATLMMFDLLRPLLKENLQHFVALSIVVTMAGLGVGAFNEIVEALVAASLPQSGVGGYVNTALDLISDFLGAILAMVFIKWRYLKCDNPR
jgi:putative membrane protein